MRILFVTASLPYPPASGGLLRIYGLLHGLKRAGHQLSLLSFLEHPINPADTPLADLCETIMTIPPVRRSKSDRLRDLLLTAQPDIARRFYSEAFAGKLREMLAAQAYDLVQFEGIESVCYLPIVRQTQPQVKCCFDTFNAEYILQRGIFRVDRRSIRRWPAAGYSWIQSRRIERFERTMCQLADCVIAVSPEDADFLRPFRPDGQVFVVPNGIFVDDYTIPLNTLDLGRNALIFTGKMDYRPNVDAALWFSERVLPLIRHQVPDAQFYIIGQQPHPRLDPLRQMPGVHLTGWVDSVRPYLAAADVYVAPLRMGSGTRLKLLEAMAAGCAIIATTAASDGLRSEAKTGMIVVEDAASAASAIVRLLQQPEARAQLGDRARALVRQYYDWSVLIPGLLDAYKVSRIG